VGDQAGDPSQIAVTVGAMVPGTASGRVVALDEPLSFWGGFDPVAGTVIDRRHPQLGVVLTGAVVVMPAGRGSSSASSVLAEAIRLGTAPAAVILTRPDLIIALGAIAAEEIYGSTCPVAVCSDEDAAVIAGWEGARLEGAVVSRSAPP
jgi:hypothetical protein